MVVVAVTGVTISLAWFMIVFMGWPVGVLEVLGLIVFVGYSITYSLHIAHKYQLHSMELEEEPLSERRRHAVVQALQSMASSVLGSAATTLGSSFFLFFCQLVIFVKLATVLFAVTFFACVFAILAL
ncbi:Disp3, partial [Symbiodinium sp. KB8]